MEQIALTRRVTASPGAVRGAVLLATFEPLRRSALWRSAAAYLVSTAGWLGALVVILDEGSLLLAGTVAVVLTVGWVALGVAFRAHHTYRMVRRDFAAGTALWSGSAAGVVRLSCPDEDLVMRTDCLHAVEERGDRVVLVGNVAGEHTSCYPRALFTDDDLALLRSDSAALLPARDDESVALTHETFLDDRWRSRVARAFLAEAATSPSWWALWVAEAAVLTAVLALLLGTASTLELALRLAVAVVLVSLWGLVQRYRLGLRSGTPPPQGLRLATGVGAAGFRLQGPTADVVHRRQLLERVRVRGDVVHVHLRSGNRLLLPRELVDVRALALLVDGGFSVRG